MLSLTQTGRREMHLRRCIELRKSVPDRLVKSETKYEHQQESARTYCKSSDPMLFDSSAGSLSESTYRRILVISCRV